MSQKMRMEMLPRLRQRYLERGLRGRSRMLDELWEQFAYSRKHAIKLLGGKAGWGGDPARRKGRPPLYPKEVVDVLQTIWSMAEQPCGKRLVPILALWLPAYEDHHGALSAEIRHKVLGISPAQADRLLAPRKAEEPRRRRCGTKPGGRLKNQIPIRTRHEGVDAPGWLEADTVAHCGGSMEGDFIWSVTYTDIYSGWTCLRSAWNRAEAGVLAATKEVERSLPFALEGFDCDNGSEFLNWHLFRYLRGRRKRKVCFTRSRPHHKDDNGHVEQKNWTHVRQLLGYGRLEDPELVGEINALYREVWEPLNNFFLASGKMLTKTRNGSRVSRRHDTPQTACDRLLKCKGVKEEVKKELMRRRGEMNPFELKRELERRLGKILTHAHPARRPSGSLPDARKTGRKEPTTPVS